MKATELGPQQLVCDVKHSILRVWGMQVDGLSCPPTQNA